MWDLNYKEGGMPNNRCFRTAVLEKTLESLELQKGSGQSVLKEIHTDYSLEGLMMKLQYFGYLMQRAKSLEKSNAGFDCKQVGMGVTKE